ncbi:MAG: L,D-transpeptidase family protein, partial [Chloroflexota bacterium]|nr:L,D-transpeptidase family protein [Chloroflexota bacterium]
AEVVLRAAPTTASDSLGLARAGTALRVLANEDQWTRVFEPRRALEAYVLNDLLQPADTPAAYIYMATPSLEEEFSSVGIVTHDVPLYQYPTRDPRAQALMLRASTRETVVGTVRADDGERWYATSDGYFLPAEGLFLASSPHAFGGRWLDVSLAGAARIIAYDGGVPVRSFFAIKGVPRWPTPQGTWSIVRRVANETMDSTTIGIPRNAPGGYFLKNVLYTQYFRETGESLHYNWWSSAWGAPGSHGCLGLSLADSKWLWDWASIGTPVVIHA